MKFADPGGQVGEGLWQFAFWDCGFEIRRGHECQSVASVCVVRKRSLRRADLSSRDVLPTVEYHCV